MTRTRQIPDTPRLRNGRLATIHVAKKKFDLDDEPYRDLLELLTGKRSAGKMTRAEHDHVINYFRGQGFKTPRGLKPVKAVLKRTNARIKERIEGGAKPQEALIFDLWEQLLRIGARNMDAKLVFFMRRMGIEASHPRFLTTGQAIKVTEGLKAWLARAMRAKELD